MQCRQHALDTFDVREMEREGGDKEKERKDT